MGAIVGLTGGIAVGRLVGALVGRLVGEAVGGIGTMGSNLSCTDPAKFIFVSSLSILH